MTTRINLNGEIHPDAHISVLDHGFLFGDSVYEVVNTHHGHLCFVNEHLRRLRNSARAISLEIPVTDEQMVREIHKTVEAAGNPDSYIRIIVTRGVGEMDIDPETCTNPNVLIFVNHDEMSGYDDLASAITGDFITDDGARYPIYRMVSEGRIKDEKFRVHLYVWIEAETQTPKNLIFNKAHEAHLTTLCKYFGADPSELLDA